MSLIWLLFRQLAYDANVVNKPSFRSHFFTSASREMAVLKYGGWFHLLRAITLDWSAGQCSIMRLYNAASSGTPLYSAIAMAFIYSTAPQSRNQVLSLP